MEQRNYKTHDVIHLLECNVRRLMDKHMVSADELSAGCDTSRSTIYNVLHCRQFLTARNIAGIANYFNIPIMELFKEPEVVKVHNEEKASGDA